MQIDDLVGIGKASEKLLDVVSSACGTLYRPTAIRREARAKAEEIRLLGRAEADVKAEKIRIVGLAEAENRLLAADTDLALLQRAKARLVAREIQHQTNIENIAQIALAEMPAAVSETPVDEDWKFHFFKVAEDITDSDMQALWGKILAGEVASPGSYSRRTLEVLRNLSKREAELFERVCSLAFTRGWMVRLIPTQPPIEAMLPGHTSLDFKEFGVSLDDLLMLESAGLLVANDGLTSTLPFANQTGVDNKQQIATLYNGIAVVFELAAGVPLTLETYVFTSAGKELQGLIKPNPNLGYLRRLAEGLRYKNIRMYKGRSVGVGDLIDIDQREEF